jgi:hypothetical protein
MIDSSYFKFRMACAKTLGVWGEPQKYLQLLFSFSFIYICFHIVFSRGVK